MGKVTLVGFGAVGKSVFDSFIDMERLSLDSIVVSRGFEESIPDEFKEKTISWTDFNNLNPRNFVVCIGYQDLNLKREEVFMELTKNGHIPVSLLHDRATISNSAIIEPGSVIFPGAIIENDAKVGKGSYIWSNSVVGHESLLGEFVFMSANVSVGGGAEIGHRCLLGLNSTVGNKVKVGNNSIVGAGTLVTKSIKDNSVIVRGNDVLLDWPAQEFLQLTDFDDVS